LRSWRSLIVGFLVEGGATIDTPPAAEGEPIGARTLIQPDGDVVVIVARASLRDEALLAEHRRQVAQWYDRSRDAVRRATLAVSMALWAVRVSMFATMVVVGERTKAGAVSGLVRQGLIFSLSSLGGWLLGVATRAVSRLVIGRFMHKQGLAG